MSELGDISTYRLAKDKAGQTHTYNLKLDGLTLKLYCADFLLWRKQRRNELIWAGQKDIDHHHIQLLTKSTPIVEM